MSSQALELSEQNLACHCLSLAFATVPEASGVLTVTLVIFSVWI